MSCAITRRPSPALPASASWGVDDEWDTKLNYKGDIGQFAVVGQVGYAENTSEQALTCGGTDKKAADCRWFGVAGTIMHKPTGLYVYGGYGKNWDNSRTNVAAGGRSTASRASMAASSPATTSRAGARRSSRRRRSTTAG